MKSRTSRVAFIFITVFASSAASTCGRSSKPDAAHRNAQTPASTRTAAPQTTTAPSLPVDSGVRDEPWVTPSDTGPVLHLPSSMARALSAAYPNFGPWAWASYPEVARSAHVHDTTASVRWVIGDFDGDGRKDVVLQGNLDTAAYRKGDLNAHIMVAIMSRPDSALVVPLTSPEREPRGTNATRPDWIVLVPRRSFRETQVNDVVGVPTPDMYKHLLAFQVFVWSKDKFLLWFDGE